jgi:photosystem II stability/assembly factor-like uncharacterized protein
LIDRIDVLYAKTGGKLQPALFLLGMLCCLLWVKPASAQWSRVAPNLLGNIQPQDGVMTSKSGIVWAGATTLYMSLDNGLTWTARSPVLFSNDNISDVNFYDGNTGIVGTANGSIYRTDDQGKTWNEIHRTPSCRSLTFCGSPNCIIIMTGAGGTAEYSLDGGITWSSYPLDVLANYVVAIGGATAYAVSGSINSAQLYSTIDHGQTWQKSSGAIQFDSYSFGVDPCVNKQVYVINEEGTTQSGALGGLSQIFVSADVGTTWTTHAGMPPRFFCGSISVSSNAVYCQTVSNGVFRSTDFGLTWKTIGGPNAPFDTRLVCAITDNLVLAVDAAGSVWRTTNSGGDTVHGAVRFKSLSIAPLTMFDEDTLLRCDVRVFDTAILSAQFCNIPSVLEQQITGQDSTDYSIVKPLPPALTGSDTVVISFLPTSSGPQQGILSVTLEDGTVLTIPLHGYGKVTHAITIGTLDASTDTIGGTVLVPIIVYGDSAIPALEFSMEFDTSVLKYDGTFTLGGKKLDVPTPQLPGRARIHADSALLASDTIIGYSYFEGFPLKDPCSKVSFDSLTVVDSAMPCAFSPSGVAISNVCLPVGCGVTTLSQFMRYHTFPTLAMYPNPAKTSLTIVATDSVSGALEIADVLGRDVWSNAVILGKSESCDINVAHLKRGKYFLRLQTDSFVTTLPLVLE